jgi:hypothetical protein
MNVVINISNKTEADFWLKLAKEKGKKAITISDAATEDAWLSDLITKGMQEQTLPQDEMQNVLAELKRKAENAN